jgi:hypothetical protein
MTAKVYLSFEEQNREEEEWRKMKMNNTAGLTRITEMLEKAVVKCVNCQKEFSAIEVIPALNRNNLNPIYSIAKANYCISCGARVAGDIRPGAKATAAKATAAKATAAKATAAKATAAKATAATPRPEPSHKKINAEYGIQPTKAYTTEEIIGLLGHDSRDEIAKARKTGTLKYEKAKLGYRYLGADVIKWWKARKANTR